jgi:hypothetical protein
MTRTILGKWAGLPAACLYVAFFFLGACRLPWYVGDFAGHILHETPITVINLVFVIAVVTAMWYGIETTARSAGAVFLVYRRAVCLLPWPWLRRSEQTRLSEARPGIRARSRPEGRGVPHRGYVALPLIALMI